MQRYSHIGVLSSRGSVWISTYFTNQNHTAPKNIPKIPHAYTCAIVWYPKYTLEYMVSTVKSQGREAVTILLHLFEIPIPLETTRERYTVKKAMYCEWLEGQPWDSHISNAMQVSGWACWTDFFMTSFINSDIRIPKAKNMAWSSLLNIKCVKNLPRLMKIGRREIHARKWPSLSPVSYLTWVKLMAFRAIIVHPIHRSWSWKHPIMEI